MSISNYLENRLLDCLRNQSGAVTVVYIKLHLGDPGEDGTANAAVETTRKLLAFAAASGGSLAATGSPVAEWTNVSTTETYTFFSLWDASTAGNCLWAGALSAAASMTAGDTFRVTALTLTLD